MVAVIVMLTPGTAERADDERIVVVATAFAGGETSCVKAADALPE